MNKAIEEIIHVVFDETNNGCGSKSSFNEFQLSKNTDEEDEGAQGKVTHQKTPSNGSQSQNQSGQRVGDNIGAQAKSTHESSRG